MKYLRYAKKRLKRKKHEVDRNYLDPGYPTCLTSWKRHPMFRGWKVYYPNDILSYSLLKKMGKFISSYRKANPSLEHPYSRHINIWK